ncbi:uncharacterized protein LOC122319539 [Drosophila yakuba]|uniref:uncharacterized protein LOC122319539 n=1 Tax=Drosophila yakuba TaxID=7245 RepID=UPI001C89909A|nr:uncharacterized protein LOC122319539 [Drosophila yakuba]
MLAKEPGPLPVCKDVGCFQGSVKVIACDDERSAELYKAAVKELREGAGLVALSWSDVPCRPRARIWIPASIKAPDQILTMLQRCNPHLPTSDWRVVKVDEMEGPTNQAILILNKEFLAPIEVGHGELNFGFSSVTIKVCKSERRWKHDRGNCL